MWFDIIKRFYDNKMWSKEMVAQAVVYTKINVEEYESIVGEPYAK